MKDKHINSDIFDEEDAEESTISLSDEEMYSIEHHIEQYIGPIGFVMHELEMDTVSVDILVVPPTPERNRYTLITRGMSALPMNIPSDIPISPYAELLIYLPPFWPILGEDNDIPPELYDNENFWPLRCLKTLAHLPHTQNIWLSYGHTVPAGNHLAPNTDLSGVILSFPHVSDDFDSLDTGEKIINFWNIVPLYDEEMKFKFEHGPEELFALFDKYKISPVIDVNRKNVCLVQ